MSLWKIVFRLFVLLIVFTPSLVIADEVVLKSGQKLEGKITEQSNKYVKIDTGIGMAVTYYMDEIDSVDGQKIQVPEPVKSLNKPIPKNTEISLPAEKPVQTLPEPNEGDIQDKGPILSDPKPVLNLQHNEPSGITEASEKEDAKNVRGDDQGHKSKNEQEIFSKAMANISRLGGFGNVFLFVIVIILIYPALCLHFISQKANRGTPWMAWIPVANCFLMCKIAGVPYTWLWFIFLALVPFVGVFCVMGLFIVIWYKIAIALNKPGWWGVLAMIPLVNIVAQGYLAFSD